MGAGLPLLHSGQPPADARRQGRKGPHLARARLRSLLGGTGQRDTGLPGPEGWWAGGPGSGPARLVRGRLQGGRAPHRLGVTSACLEIRFRKPQPGPHLLGLSTVLSLLCGQTCLGKGWAPAVVGSEPSTLRQSRHRLPGPRVGGVGRCGEPCSVAVLQGTRAVGNTVGPGVSEEPRASVLCLLNWGHPGRHFMRHESQSQDKERRRRDQSAEAPPT